ncbi:fluoride efflux transporter CrcB [Salinibacterium sp. G-O1]|uniref:fluoride efflux transporter CrcB n=1 Tax=Salinibacterium sp. G-O1 TaxID=3046208 RepID=UPI0024B8F806|nr:fluoride efflux transporter CrcB [Salinibacterium sp. G-O1]MDJ0333821.1 fluoride efflux transporter CrcB [Salinibacterium sp. G-O1]
MIVILVTMLAGAAGAVIRYLVVLAFAGRSALPWAVLIVNVVGSAAGGVIVGLAASGGMSDDIRLILLTGLCGGLTTFSTFSVETIQLVHEGKWRVAALSVGLNLVLGVAAAAAGYLLAR